MGEGRGGGEEPIPVCAAFEADVLPLDYRSGN